MNKAQPTNSLTKSSHARAPLLLNLKPGENLAHSRFAKSNMARSLPGRVVMSMFGDSTRTAKKSAFGIGTTRVAKSRSRSITHNKNQMCEGYERGYLRVGVI